MKFQIGYFQETANGKKWHALKYIERDTDAEAEAEVDMLAKCTPRDLDGRKRNGLFIRRGTKKWFRRFSCHAVR